VSEGVPELVGVVQRDLQPAGDLVADQVIVESGLFPLFGQFAVQGFDALDELLVKRRQPLALGGVQAV
jgi:hypothetical protein